MNVQQLAATAERWRADGRNGVLARIVGTTGLGPRPTDDLLLVDESGRVEGTLLGGAADRAVVRAATEMIAAGRHQQDVVVEIGDSDAATAGLTCGGVVEVALQHLDTVPASTWDALAAGRAVPRLLIVGASDLSAALTRQVELLGWAAATTVGADASVGAAERLSAADAVIVVDHDPSVATPVLAAALRGAAGYVGALGSRRTQALRREHLAAARVSSQELARLHGPTGLDIGAGTPEESAVSIVAEIIAARTGRSGAPLSGTSGRISGSRDG